MTALTPYPWQQSDITWLLDSGARGFIAADTGAGKTLIAIEVGLQGDFGTRLIVAPKGTHERVWRRDIMRQDPNAVVRVIEGSTAGQDAFDALQWGEPGWYLVSPQLFTRWSHESKVKGRVVPAVWTPSTVRPDLAIIDEAHLLGARGTKGQKALYKLAAKSRIVMSGTMARNRFENLWGLCRWVYPMLDGQQELADVNYQRWVTEWCRTVPDRFDPSGRKIIGEKRPGRLANEMPVWVQHFKRRRCCDEHPEGFLHDLPEPREIEHTVDLLPAQRTVMRALESSYIAWLEDHSTGGRRAIVAKLPLVARTRLRQATLAVPTITGWTERVAEDGSVDMVPELDFLDDAESPKFDDLVATWNVVQEPIVATTTSQKFAAYAVRRLTAMGIRAFEWSGAVSQKRRDEALQQFEDGGFDIVVGVTSAIGTGIDGLQQASGVLFDFETDPDMTNTIQMEGRLDRRGQKRTDGVLHYRCLALDSLDLGILGSQLQRRLEMNRTLQRRAA